MCPETSDGDPDSMVLGLPDPDPLVRGMDLDPFSHKGVERTERLLAK
jgi:hypothetical protein